MTLHVTIFDELEEMYDLRSEIYMGIASERIKLFRTMSGRISCDR